MNERVGDYEILGVLGAGGMGRIFKVRNVITDRVEAMKILLPNLAGRQELAERFLREIKVLAALSHSNIAGLRTAFTLQNQLVMIMEYVEGFSLGTRLEQGSLPPADALNYTDQVLQALSYAHQQGVIHRDIKPANIMVTPQGVVKLMDFGIARSASDRSLTATGMTVGSLYYMSPEQVKGEAIDARSDLYSVGITLYEMVTGKRPFDGTSDFSILTAQVQQLPKPPIELRADLPVGLNEIILTALAKDPNQRFQTAEAFRRAVNSVRAGQVQAEPGMAVAAAAQAIGAQSTSPAAVASSSATSLFQNAIPAGQSSAAGAGVSPRPESQNQFFPDVADGSPPSRGHRSLYVMLGAGMVLLALLASAVYLPRRSRTLAGANSASSAQTTVTPPVSAPSTTSPTAENTSIGQPASSAASASPNANEASTPASAVSSEAQSTTGAQLEPRSTKQSDSPASSHRTVAGSSARSLRQPDLLQVVPAEPQPSASHSQGSGISPSLVAQPGAMADAGQLEELERQMDQLSSRVASVNDTLNRMRQQQAASGLGLRGDVASAQERLATYMGKAEAALHANDAKTAKRYLDLAEPEIEKLEKFLGR